MSVNWRGQPDQKHQKQSRAERERFRYGFAVCEFLAHP
jgi:hypothetical protein